MCEWNSVDTVVSRVADFRFQNQSILVSSTYTAGVNFSFDLVNRNA